MAGRSGRNRRRLSRGAAGVLVGLMFTAVACDRQTDQSQAKREQTPKPATAVAAQSPANDDKSGNHQALEQVKTLEPVSLADVQKIIAQAKADKKILVIDFWATWCLPCLEMFPELHEKLPALSPRVQVVTITLDSPGKYEARAVDFLRQHHAMDHAYRLGGEAPQWEELVAGLGKRWQNLQVPAILVYDDQGQLWDEFIDARARPQLIVDRVKELLQAPTR